MTGFAVLVMLASTAECPAAGRHVFARQARDAARRGDAAGIVEAARAAHRAMSSLTADGETTTRMSVLGQEQSFGSTFSMRLARPNRYRIAWTGTGGPMPDQRGAVWNTGSGAFVYVSSGTYSRALSDEVALTTAQGVSGGLTADVWAIFSEGGGLLADLRAPTLAGTEDVDGEPCWKITGSSRTFERMSLWIATKRLVLRKVEHSMALSQEGQAAMEAPMDDAQLDQGLHAAGVEPTPERRAQMKAMAEFAKSAAKAMGRVDGLMTRVLHRVQVDDRLTADDFAFEVPAGTQLQSSTLAGVLGDDEPAKPAAPPAPAARTADPVVGRQLLDRVLARYAALRSYAAEGETAHRITTSSPETLSTTFSLTLARPDRYRVVWWAGRHADGAAAEGAVWNAGDGQYQYGRLHGAYVRHRDTSSAFAVAAGVSRGLTRGMPALFFRSSGDWFTEIRDPVFEGKEAVDGTQCDVVSGWSRASAKHTLWIDSDLLIRRHRRLHELRPEDARNRQESEDYAFEKMKREATPEMKPMIEMMAAMQKARGTSGLLGGETTDTYRSIRVDGDVAAADVTFDVPPGTPLKASLTEGMFRAAQPPMN
jgi:hypothetical protein